jgi:CheY-like chemotaxis protein
MSSGTILIVEDEKDLRDVYSLILKHNGYTVCIAKNGAEGLEQVAVCNPSLVLLDIFMPVLDGKGFLEKLDKSKYPNMNIVVCSNTSDADLMEDMRRLGAVDVVTKSKLTPADIAELVQPYMLADA